MSPSSAVISILVALMLGAISPGPSFVIVVRNAISLSRKDGLATALGMGLGGVIFSGVALVGLYQVLASISWLYLGLKIAGGVYLIYLASRIWRGAKQALAVDGAASGQPGNPVKSFWVGLSTQLSNPKTAIYYASIFAALLPQHPPLWCYFVLPPAIFVIEAGWYTVVALSFSSRKPRAWYLKSKTAIDRLAAGAIAILGLRLLWKAPQSGL
ncbi:MAG TPA: LysE family transporter [Burkholderiaceae bacterium]|jgi:threonine/homoserine/homoserine lactone efflux protein